MRWIFWVSLWLIAYTYVGYPLWLYFRTRWCPRPVRSAPLFPSVSIVMAAHNEAETLPRKLRNLAQLDYPRDRYEIVVVSDGSTDATSQILASQAHQRLRIFSFPQRQGKAAALNRGVQEARGEIIVFTDARQLIAPDSVRHLASNFADPAVGCVSGELMLGEPNAPAASGVGLYWRMEKKIRQWESARGSVVGATGALYAARKGLLVPLPLGTILDDVYLPLLVARQGGRIVFEPQARAWDRTGDPQREFRRKVRTLTGNYQLVQLAPWLLTRANPIRFEFVCHKLLRLLIPFVLASILVSSLFLQGAFYKLALALQVLFYALAALTVFGPKLGLVSRLADVSLAFLTLNTAAAVAFVYFVAGKKEVWVQ